MAKKKQSDIAFAGKQAAYHRPAVSAAIDMTSSYSDNLTLQRASTCPCDGGCPRCATGIQPKLKIGQPNDKYEQEADRVADQVMRMPEPKVQRQIEEDEKEEILQTKPIADQITPLVQRQIEPEEKEEEEPIQAKPADGGLLQRQEEEVLQGKFTPNGTLDQLQEDMGDAEDRTGVPGSLKEGLEHLSGMDLSGVRVHKNSSKPSRLNALAYTQGQDIHVGPGQEKHLPHEGWHAVQQMQGRVKPTIQAKGVSINNDAGLEREADVMGVRALQRIPFGRNSGNQMAPASLAVGPSATHSMRPTIQRAMKFEFQTRNVVWRTGGKKRKKLPRKFGPTKKPKHSRFLHKGSKGKPAKGAKEGTAIELQSEARGFVEFETPSWHRKWCAIKKRVQEAVSMVDKIKISKVVSMHGSVKTFEFPFDIKHLKKTKDFRKGLKAGESLEVEEIDKDWNAKIQASESFELSHFQPYMEEHLPASAPLIAGSAEKILQAANTKKIPDKDLGNLRNFLQIIIEHITQARKWSRYYHKKGRKKLAKEHISLMSRTNFSSIYRTLLSSKGQKLSKEQKLFIKIVKSNVIPKELGLKPKSRIFPKGFIGRKSPGPKIREWLVSIYNEKRDLLSSLGGDNRALGRFNVDTTPGKKHTNLVKFEARATSGHTASRPVTEWVTFAKEVFKAAHANRPRTGSTELIYDPKKCP